MISPLRSVLLLGVLFLVGACSSTVVRYHSLMPDLAVPADPAGGLARPGKPLLFSIQPVGLPALVDRQEFVARQGGQVLILENERWATMLGDEMREALGTYLQRALGGRNVTGLVPPPDAPVLGVTLMVRQFESAPGQYTLVDADWALAPQGRGEKGERMLCHAHNLTKAPVGGGGNAELAKSYQAAFAMLAGQIAESGRRWMASERGVCP